MQKHIEDAVLAGTAVAIDDMRNCGIPEAAHRMGITVWSPNVLYDSTVKLCWENPEAEKANNATLAKIAEFART